MLSKSITHAEMSGIRDRKLYELGCYAIKGCCFSDIKAPTQRAAIKCVHDNPMYALSTYQFYPLQTLLNIFLTVIN